MFNRKMLGGVALTALSFAFAGAAAAQETTAAVRGEVVSDTGMPIEGAQIVITHVPTGTRSVTQSNAAGVFDARGLRVGGPFTVEISAQDYRGERIEDLFLGLGEPARLTVDLEQVTGEVVVVAQRQVLGGAVGSATTLTRDDLDAIVSVNRDIRDLARRSPLVSQTAGGNQGIRIAGSNPRTNRITIDGTQAQDDFGLNTGGLPTRRGPVSLDAIETFQVEAVPFDVENGDFLGGAINVVLAQGTNDFDGSVFANYLNDGLVGKRLDGQESPLLVTQENWGGTLRGPILKDRLFFALSYETYESADVTERGPVNQGFANTINGPGGAPVTQAQIDQVVGIYTNTYRGTRPLGSIPLTAPITDEKMTGRIDWNIADGHRAFATYRYSESGLIQRTNLGTTSAGLSSQWYLTGEEDQTFAFQVNSDWTSRLSTEVRYSQRDYNRLQEPPNGQNFSDVSVCLSAASGGSATGCDGVAVVRFGPDQFRHANFLQTQNQQARATADYSIGRHSVKAGVEWQRQDIFNLFLPSSDGVYYFDSVADFQAGRANQLVYRNALTNDANDGAAAFEYHIWSGFLQDTWDITDTLTLIAGLRYDYYTNDDQPVFNPNFRNRYGFSNQETYDGRDVIMPRFAFEWDALDNLEVTGGAGLFSGGLPDVFLSNSFSNTGFIDNSLDFRRSGSTLSENNGNISCTASPTVCNDALNVAVGPGFGASVPQSVRDALAGLTASPFGETNSIAPDFEIPSDWRVNLSAAYERWGFDFGFDAVYVRTNEGLAFRDLRATPLLVNGQQARTPDGRIRYDGLNDTQRNAARALGVAVSNVRDVRSTIPVATSGSGAGAIGNNRDIQAFNPDEENTYLTLAASVARAFDNGVDFFFAYTFQDFEEFSSSARFASTANSLYSDQPSRLDPNASSSGEALEEIENSFRGEIGWRRSFIGDLETRFSLFGEWTEGRKSTPVMGQAGGGRNPTFGVNKGNFIAYIPNLSGTVSSTGTGANTVVRVSSDTNVVFDSQTTLDRVRAAVQGFNLSPGISSRGAIENDDIARFDLSISQELPTYFQGHRALLSFEVQNVGNLLNDEWGLVRTRGENLRLFDVSCAGADGLADNDGVVTCQTYRISNAPANALDESLDGNTSRWYIQVGLRYQF